MADPREPGKGLKGCDYFKVARYFDSRSYQKSFIMHVLMICTRITPQMFIKIKMFGKNFKGLAIIKIVKTYCDVHMAWLAVNGTSRKMLALAVLQL